MKKKHKIPRKFNLPLFMLLSGLMDGFSRMQIDYLRTEIRILRQQLRKATGHKRVYLTNDQRRLLAVKAKPLGIKVLGEITDLFSPETIIGWYRKLVASKYDGAANRKGGRKKVSQNIIDMVLRMAQENRGWGYRKIHSYMIYLDFEVSASTVQRIMRDHGLEPDPAEKNKSTWSEFIRRHMDVICACDFFQVEVLTLRGLVRCSVLFFIELNSRRVHILPSKVDPSAQWVEQQAKNICGFEDGIFSGRTYLVHDRDPLFMKTKFRDILEDAGVESIETAPASPNQNAFSESFIGRAKESVFDKMIFTSQKQLDYCLKVYEDFYNHYRPHRGLGGKMIDLLPQDKDGEIVCKEFLGGLLKSYHRVKKRPEKAA